MDEHKLSLLDRAKRKFRKDGLVPLMHSLKFKTERSVHKALLPHFPSLSKSPPLKEAYLELTNVCNLKCKMCYSKDQASFGFMDKTLFKDRVNQFGEFHPDNLSLHYGGEVLLHPHFKECLFYAIQNRNEGGVKAVCWTDNGTLFTEDIAKLSVDLEVDSISFSLDGLRETNDKIRVGSNYDEIEANILKLLELRGNKCKPVISINAVDYGKTAQELAEFIKAWTKRVDSVSFIPCVAQNGALLNVEEYYKRHKIKMLSFCYNPFKSMFVCWNGKVTTCCVDLHCRLNLGDANKQALKEIWVGPSYNALRQNILSGTIPQNSLCKSCDYWKYEFVPAKETSGNGVALYYEAEKKKFVRELP